VTSTLRGEHRDAARPKLWRVTQRATFSALRRDGRRARRGPLTVTWMAPAAGDGTDGATPPRVAFAIGRSVGGAVVRNRIRRRLRGALGELQRQGALPTGTYLLSGDVRLADLPWSELVALTGDLVASATGSAA
jgi:ribonuclease P protein component